MILSRVVLIACLSGAVPLFSQTVTIPDKHFLNALIEEGVDRNGDHLISTNEAGQIRSLDIAGKRDEGKGGEIKSLAGIEAFVNLDMLRCNHNQISELDLSNNTFLSFLRCNDNQLTSLDVTACSALLELNPEGNQLTELNLAGNPLLEKLVCSKNKIITLDISNNTRLKNIVLCCKVLEVNIRFQGNSEQAKIGLEVLH